ncbi:hypothetical protein PIB30_001438 [Stylosanthes scabra]|uniref:Uncharacterized protein n=1 Tax=Stylosanthes scabra TaxID=79078 RepID=A0ABU6Z0N6_9FABA|nr:hypothetical protein [Stylosanthes scabra]
MSDEELVFCARRLRRMMRYNGKGKGSSSKENKKDQNKVICYNYRKPEHYKSDNPQKKKGKNIKKDKKKVLMVSWEDLENDSEDDDSDHEAQLCFIADTSEYDEPSLNCILTLSRGHAIRGARGAVGSYFGTKHTLARQRVLDRAAVRSLLTFSSSRLKGAAAAAVGRGRTALALFSFWLSFSYP